jgi:hypothetical protein
MLETSTTKIGDSLASDSFFRFTLKPHSNSRAISIFQSDQKQIATPGYCEAG